MVKRLALLMCLFVMDGGYTESQVPEDEHAEFYFTRLMYNSGRGGFGRGRGGSWATDYPEADYKLMWGIQRMTNIRLFPDQHPVQILDEELFQYPFVYAVEVGQMNLSLPEAQRLREYLDRGGFWYCDDFWGLGEWANFEAQMRKVFPDRKIERLDLKHDVFHSFFDVDKVMQIPNINNGRALTRYGRGRTWEDSSDTEPGVFGISDDLGRLMVLATYNSDLGDAWEWMDDPEYPEPYTAQAYKMAMNFIIYSMTH
jgi:hypothetical protein